MDKIILVIYIYVGEMSTEKAKGVLTRIVEKMQPSSDSILHYYIPVKKGESRIECINPKTVSEDEYKTVKEVLEKCKKKLNEYLNGN